MESKVIEHIIKMSQRSARRGFIGGVIASSVVVAAIHIIYDRKNFVK